ncbi:glycosyl hydrolase [Sphingomonas sp.]|uniref:glycosyl hydrolase n=1 Tax=Sphingomonas sp. TaxID=28214 RepID=UPI0025EF357F|nr:glycosyl hydrolase [Sphingomonas sp.]
MVENSVYIDNKASSVIASQSWLGGHLDSIQLVGGIANWWDWSNSPAWIAQQVAGLDVDIHWSIGLIPWGATLEDAAAGKYASQYLALARSMVASAGGDDKIYVRLGWEMNYPGWPWSVQGHEAAYVGAFRQFVDTFRSVSDKFVFEWTPQAGNPWLDKTTDPTIVYPGDKYVDVIGLDLYNVASSNQAAVFNWFVNAPYGLEWQQDFAAAHGKQTALSEWGVSSDTAGPFIERIAQWARDHGMLYQNYWNSNAAFPGSLLTGQYPTASAVFRAIFADGADPYAWDVNPIVDTGTAGVDLLIGHGGNDMLKGGAEDDFIHGRGGNDLLDGGTGADLMIGGSGNDTYYVDNAGDEVVELQAAGEGYDTVYASVSYGLAGTFVEELRLTGSANINATGNSQANALHGNAGNNILDGRGGADLMIGGSGNDTYYVDNAGDRVVELQAVGEGYDTVYASVSYDLAATFVEELRLTGSANINATGNSQVNSLYGNAGNNVLNGRGGADLMAGGKGDDIYYVDNAGDKVVELQAAGEGNDTVYASVSYGLAATFVETMWLTGSANIDATGNSQANTLHGNGGNNVINGMGGDDLLFGGGGSDRFVFTQAGHSRIADFGAGDTLDLSASLKAGKQPTLAQTAAGAMLTIDANTSILIEGLALSHLIKDSAGFHFV